MCSVLLFEDENSKLRSLFNESNHFDSLVFIFDGCRRYKLTSQSLGIHSPMDLLLPLGLGLFRNSPFWNYYLYPSCKNFNKGIDGLCGEVIRLTGLSLQEQSCHIFIDHSRRQLHLLYLAQGEYRLELRRLKQGTYSLSKHERTQEICSISWNRLNILLTTKNFK